KKEFDQQCSNDHCDIKTGDDKAGDFPAVILAVDIDDREDDQVGVNERDDAAETDAAVPKDRSQRNVARNKRMKRRRRLARRLVPKFLRRLDARPERISAKNPPAPTQPMRLQ